ncbi:MAG: hemolysin family protein [Chloroflexi bacterium]|nr:hemolysin family protein [Chloroflexota bacterium]
MEIPTQTITPIWLPIAAALLIVLANAFFVIFEFTIVTVRRGQMERLADEGNPAAGLILRMLRDPDWAIAGSQVGITMASILLGVVAEEPLQRLLAPVLTQTLGRVPFLAGLSAALATVLILLLLSFFHMVLGEQTPKTIALRYPVRCALLVARPMTLFARVASPLVWLVDQSTGLALKVLGIGGQTGGHGIHTVEELKEVVRESQNEGVIPYDDEQMLLRAVEFGARFVREAMIPRTDIVAAAKTDTVGDLLRTFKTSRHSRFPIYEGDLDHICGIVTMKEVLARVVDNPDIINRSLAEVGVIQPAFVVPDSRRIGPLFNEIRRDRIHMAIVIDEFGGTAGLITAEELAEEVVGRLTDEWVTEPPTVAAMGGGVFEIDAQTRVDEVNEALKLDLPTSPDYETVAGFLLFQIRRIPKHGETIVYDDLRFTVLKMVGPKIERLRVEHPLP